MTLLEIARLGHPVLITPAEPVRDPAEPEPQRLIDDMIETLEDAGGLGLAAPQVHRRLRLILARPLEEGQAREEVPPLVLIDPELELGEEDELAIEGCLSLPGLRGVVPRAKRVRYRGVDRHGRPLTGEAEGVFARILQHEVDHLDGILFLMRMPDLRYLAYEEEMEHLLAALETQGEQQ